MDFFHFLSRPGLLFCMAAVPYVSGRAALRIMGAKRGQKFQTADAMLIGWILCIGLAETVHLAAVLLGRSFSDAVKLLALAYALLFAAAACVLLYGYCRFRRDRAAQREKRRREARSRMEYKPFTVPEAALCLGFVLIAVYQLMTIGSAEMVYRQGDQTVETVESFLETDAFYQVNPLTGRPYELGMPLRLKILCLPTLYAFFCRMFGLTGAEVVWEIVPAMTLIGCYLAMYVLAGCFFPRDGEREKREIFMLFAAVLFCVGDYMYGMDGFGLLYSGFRGVTIRNAVLLPYTFGLALRRRWKTAALCVLAEACIAWTLYGMGACLLAGLLFWTVQKLSGKISRGGKSTGEEARAEWSG